MTKRRIPSWRSVWSKCTCSKEGMRNHTNCYKILFPQESNRKTTQLPWLQTRKQRKHWSLRLPLQSKAAVLPHCLVVDKNPPRLDGNTLRRLTWSLLAFLGFFTSTHFLRGILASIIRLLNKYPEKVTVRHNRLGVGFSFHILMTTEWIP